MMLAPRLLLKRGLKRTAGTAAVLSHSLGLRRSSPGGCVLVYHRLTAAAWHRTSLDNWNVTPERFAAQMAAIAESCECVPLLDLPRRVAAPRTSDRPLVSITFDDGFHGVAAHALPVLERYGLPATVFLVTSCVGRTTPMPFDRWGARAAGHVAATAWRPMDWRDVDSLLASPLITVGSHSHLHRDGSRLSQRECRAEAQQSRDVLRRRCGDAHARAFAYPYGSARLGHVSDVYVAAVRDAGYELAASTELGMVTPSSSRWLLPRVEASGVDTPRMIMAKAAGALLPFFVTDRLRQRSRA
ncbi:MAG: polysaccharide deacetylase family protein [Vicinamibacterales bacterium]